MNNITLTIELSAEDRAKLDNILEAIKGLAVAPCVEAEAPKAEAKKEAVTPAKPEPAPAEPAEQPAPEPEPEPEPQKEAAPEVTTAELQSKVVQLVGAGKKDPARAIVTEYAKSVSEIPADKRAEVLDRLNALEG